VIVQKRSNDILQVVALESDKDSSHDTLFLSNYASMNMVDELKRVKGVGDVTIFGAQDYSMRVWLKPDRMAQLGLTDQRYSPAIRIQNAQNAAGKIGQEPAPKRPAAGLHGNRQGPPADSGRIRQYRHPRQRPRRRAAPEGRGAHRTRRGQLRPAA
jgi:multidrug efflux pump subunit AcrB